MPRMSRWLGATAVLAAAAAAPLAAQTRHVTVSGVVSDSLRPLEHATVEIFGTRQSRLTAADGSFRFDSLRSGPYWFRVRRIGYLPVTFTATLLEGTRTLDVRLEPAAHQLSELEVRGGMSSYRYSDFRWRSRTAWGKFFTRDDIARLRPFDVVDLALRGLPGWSRWDLEQPNWFEPGSGRTGFTDITSPAAWTRRPGRAGGCPPAISRNGNTPWPGWSLRDFDLEEVEAVEVYRSRNLPIEFQGGSPGCGLVVVWLR